MALAAKEADYAGIIVPFDNGREASVVKGLSVFPVKTLSQVVTFFQGFTQIEPETADISAIFDNDNESEPDFSEVMGQEHVKRALEIAAAGGHNLIMVGPPGSGKTMLARRLPTIMPPLSLEESLETTRIYSAAGELRPGSALLATR